MKTLDILMLRCSSLILSEGQAEAQLCLSGNEKGDKSSEALWLAGESAHCM